MERVHIMVKTHNAYQLGLYEKSMPSMAWQDTLAVCKRNGFDYLEMSIDESEERLARLNYTKKQRAEVRNAIWESEIPIRSICLSGHRKYPLGAHDEQIRKQSLEIMSKAIQLACDIGIRLIQLAGYDVYYEESDAKSKAYFLENLIKCTRMAARAGVCLGFETMETPFMDTVKKAMYYVDKVQSPYLGMYPDIGNLKNASLLYHTHVHDDLVLGKGHVFAAHLKETKPNHYREVPYGSGHTEYVDNIRVLKAQGVRLFVGEFWYTGGQDWEKDIANGNRFLREKLDYVFTEEDMNE